MPDRSVSKAPDRIVRMFSAIAGRYDFFNHLLSLGIDRRWRRRAVRALALTGRERVLDLCTGTADLALAIGSAAGRVVGVDFAAGMLAVARDKVRVNGIDGPVILVRGDAVHIPIADRAVDAVSIAFGIRNVENAQRACDEVYRVLKPGGRLVILEFGVPPTPILRPAYLWYLNHALPRIARLLSRQGWAYEYLPGSIGAFASPDQFMQVLRRSGFADVAAVPLTGGIVFMYTALRSEAGACGSA